MQYTSYVHIESKRERENGYSMIFVYSRKQIHACCLWIYTGPTAPIPSNTTVLSLSANWGYTEKTILITKYGQYHAVLQVISKIV